MSYLEKLLNGAEVEWKKLEDISEIYGGLTGKSKVDFEKGNAKYITYKNIFSNIEVDFNILESVQVSDNERQHEVKYGDILFTGSSETANEAGMSSAVTTKFDEKVYLNSFSFGLRFNDDIEIIPEFAKYLFRIDFMRKEISKSASGVTRFNVSKARFKRIKIPIPPLEVQKEIVRILDTFTELTAELTAELEARKKQYEYYRDKLLNFSDMQRGGVKWLTMSELATDKLAYGAGASAIEFDGEIRYIRITDITENGNLTNVPMSPSDFEEKYLLKDGDILLARSGATVGKNFYYKESFGKAIYAGYLIRLQVNREIAEPKYIYHYLNSSAYNNFVANTKSSGSQPNINAKQYGSFKIPVPSLEEQERIVGILDQFDTLVHSISEGLPKEIALRQQQYEYYRNELLNFE